MEGHYHLTLAIDGEPVMQGWWASEPTARRKFSAWVHERGSMPGARIDLTDEETGLVLATWVAET